MFCIVKDIRNKALVLKKVVTNDSFMFEDDIGELY